MWRSIIIHQGERLSTRQEWLVLEMEDGQKKEMPLADLYSIVVDNPQMSITVPLLAKLASYQIHLITTDEKHMPISETFPLNTHYRCYKVIKQQVEMSADFKGCLWQKIISAKIHNQAAVVANATTAEGVVERLKELAMEVLLHDLGNREGIAAKMFFRNLYGATFIRSSDDKINAGLDYGYAILRSGVAKSLVAYGFNCVIGIHHISETNAFNLADDFMEPLRPIVDAWVIENIDLLEEGLSRTAKTQLIDLVNQDITFDGKRMKVRYAIDMMIRSLVSAIESQNPSRLLLPKIDVVKVEQ